MLSPLTWYTQEHVGQCIRSRAATTHSKFLILFYMIMCDKYLFYLHNNA